MTQRTEFGTRSQVPFAEHRRGIATLFEHLWKQQLVRMDAGRAGVDKAMRSVVGCKIEEAAGGGDVDLLEAFSRFPTDVRRVADPAPQTVSLARGASARSLLHWGVVPADDEPGTECEPTATAVVVTPPDQTSAAMRPWTFGPVCQHGRIHQNAYVPGSDAF